MVIGVVMSSVVRSVVFGLVRSHVFVLSSENGVCRGRYYIRVLTDLFVEANSCRFQGYRCEARFQLLHGEHGSAGRSRFLVPLGLLGQLREVSCEAPLYLRW